ncbi:unnamed protein product [Parajaminaea phylloscopi]
MTSQSQIKTIALVGAGGIGLPVAKALLDAGFALKVLSRTSTAKAGLEKAQTIAVDYADSDAISQALKGVDVVVTTVHPDLELVSRIADAAKAQAVKLFVTPDWGVDIDRMPVDLRPPEFQIKNNIVQHLRDIQLPFLRIYNGAFADFLFSPLLGFVPGQTQFHLIGSGDALISASAKEDIAAFLTKLLVEQPLSELQNRGVTVQSFQQTLRQYVAQYEQAKGVKLDIVGQSAQEAAASLATLTDPRERFVTGIKLSFDKGLGEAQSDNERYGFKPKYASPADYVKATA